MLKNNDIPSNTTWAPKEKYVNIMKNEIKEYVEDGFDEDYLDKCSKIGAFLMDKDEVMKGLKQLNDEILKKVTNPDEYMEFISTTTIDAKALSNPETRKQFQVGVLRSFLENELERMGFEPEFAKSIGYIDAPLFRETIRGGMFVKDKALGTIHGEFAHPIQWLLIAWQQERTKFLGDNVRVVDIFKKLGDDKSVFKKKTEKNINVEGFIYQKGIWDLVGDRQKGENDPELGEYDLRNPDNLTALITSNESAKTIPALNAMVSFRTKKRKEETVLFSKNKLQIHEKYVKSNKSDKLEIPKKKAGKY